MTHLNPAPDPGSAICLGDETIAALLDDLLDAEGADRARSHIASCGSCRQLLAASARARPSAAAGRTDPTEAGPLARGTGVGRYVILGVVGAGGMSVVYAAYDPALDRKVALKFLRLPRTPGEGLEMPDALTRRLQREAQAMARLSHPNVVAVHDIGTFEGNVFLAMEFVDGCTLAEWCSARPRTQAEVLAVFQKVGQGLAAAHAVGIVHRDFKPSNVLISERGDVRVTDFGLARLLREADDLLGAERASGSRPGGASLPSLPAGSALGDLSLTQLGAALGTPAYMAPEQFTGEPADARSDQYSFCVALYEALYKERPFVAPTIAELARIVDQGQLRPPANSAVPSWLRGVLLRGLSRERSRRYPSMGALLAALGANPRRRLVRTLWGLLALALLVGASVGGYAVRKNEALICRGAERKLKGVWDGAQQRAVEDAFHKTGRAFARDAWLAVERALSAYSAGFVAMHTEACEATRLRGEQSEALLDLRMGCLEQRRQELAALTALFAGADAQIVENAPRAALSLPRLAACADVARLQQRVPPPGDPATRARITELSNALARVRAQRSAGQYKQAMGELTKLLPEVQQLGWRPLSAQYLHTHALLRENTGDHPGAEETYYQALWAAEAAREDELAAEAWLDILYSVGYWQAKYPQVERLQRHADAALGRIGSPPPLMARLFQIDGMLRSEQGDQAASLKALRQALVLYEKASGPEHPDVARTLTSLAVASRRTGQLDEAERGFRRALAIADRNFGPRHPNAAIARANLAGLLVDTGRMSEGLELHKSALLIYEQVYPPNDIHLAQAQNGLGAALGSMRRFREAHEHFLRALAIQEKQLGAQHPRLINTLSNLGEAAEGFDALDEALAAHQRALQLIELTQGSDHPNAAATASTIAGLYLRRDQPQLALPHFQRSLAIHEKALPGQPGPVAADLLGTGECLLLAHQPSEAVQRLQRAIGLLDVKTDRALIARVNFALARALWDAGREPDRALALAQAAQRELPPCEPGQPAARCDRARLAQWLQQPAVQKIRSR